MPKPTKLHDKGRPISIQKANLPKQTEGSTEIDNERAMQQFQLELCWCVQHLERSLISKKDSDKKIQDTWKTLQVLKNNNQPIVRKRQLMRTYFGDYRAKMLAEEKKLVKMANKMKITEKPSKPKATFLRKSVFQTTGDSAFRFNFNITPEDSDTTNNLECQKDGNPERKDDNTVTDSGDGNNKIIPVAEVDKNTFKFKFSESEFRFNFNIDKSNGD